ncbi:acetyl-CoA C-acyltransferase [Pararhodobacter sp.]|uniref:acetyl-CoA C-acyltransferase n=1 Tax=Pararhodobacter sp. TaxID=2127056 RepID=UPI002FDD0974
MRDIVIIDALRTPRGRGNAKGALAGVKPVNLLAGPLRALARRHPEARQAGEAVFGCVTQTGEQGANIGKLALIAAGYPDAVPGLSVNRYCASGISAVRLAALVAGASDGLALAGGVESMSRLPMASDKGPLTHDLDFQRAAGLVPIGISADAIATQEGFSRADCDAYAAQSQARAVRARQQGRFTALVPLEGLAADETPRAGTSAEALAALPPAFTEMGAKYGFDAALAGRLGLPEITHVHHAGNSPAMADGAAAVLLASAAAAARAGLRPRARILGMAELAVDRVLALTGAVDASRAALAQAGLRAADIDLFEVNESFAALMLHYARHMDIPTDRLNINGGAIALGHPMGATGAVLLSMAIEALEQRGGGRAVVAACGAAGLASALVIETVSGAAA